MLLNPFFENYTISRRETEILHLISAGYSNKEIGEKLFISEFTVETHRKNMIRKAGVKNSCHLMMWAFSKGVLGI